MRLTEHMKKVVQEQALGFVATVCPDGTPNLSPKGTTSVWDEEHLVFLQVDSAAPLVSPVYDDGTPEREVVRRWLHRYTDLHGPC